MLRRLRNSPELRFAGPVILENTATVFIGLVFSTIIGGISESALAAVGLVNSLINVLVSLAAFLSIGSAALIARLVGEGDPAATSRAVEQSVWMAAVTGIAVTVVCELLSIPILHLLLPGADAQVMDEGLRYFRALCLSFPFLLIMSIVGGALRAAGESAAPMVGAVLMNLVQIAAAYWMISVMGWSVTGAGMSYVVCRAFGMAVVLTACLRSHRHFSVTLRGMLRPSREMGKRIARLGLPSTLESASVQVCYLLANSMAMGLGTLEAGVYQVSNTLSAFSTLPQGIFSAIGVTFIGQALGENRPDKAVACQKKLLRIALAVSLTMGLTLSLLGPELVKLYTRDEYVRAQSAKVLWVWLLFDLPGVAINVNDPILRTGGDTKMVMAYTAALVWGVRIPLTWLFCYVWTWGAAGVVLANVISVIIRAIVGQMRIRGGKWLSMKV